MIREEINDARRKFSKAYMEAKKEFMDVVKGYDMKTLTDVVNDRDDWLRIQFNFVLKDDNLMRLGVAEKIMGGKRGGSSDKRRKTQPKARAESQETSEDALHVE